jgi:hypothetical protein
MSEVPSGGPAATISYSQLMRDLERRYGRRRAREEAEEVIRILTREITPFEKMREFTPEYGFLPPPPKAEITPRPPDYVSVGRFHFDRVFKFADWLKEMPAGVRIYFRYDGKEGWIEKGVLPKKLYRIGGLFKHYPEERRLVRRKYDFPLSKTNMSLVVPGPPTWTYEGLEIVPAREEPTWEDHDDPYTVAKNVFKLGAGVRDFEVEAPKGAPLGPIEQWLS